MAQGVKAPLVVKSEEPSSSPRTHIVEKEKALKNCPLTSSRHAR